jgi:hypothetical protein
MSLQSATAIRARKLLIEYLESQDNARRCLLGWSRRRPDLLILGAHTLFRVFGKPTLK